MRYKLNKKHTLFLIVYAIITILSVSLTMGYSHLSTLLISQQGAQRWQGENQQRFSQISCFFSSDYRATPQDIGSFRKMVNEKLSESSQDKVAWIDAYSAQSETAVKSPHDTVNTTVFGVGGEYFFFHPLYLRSGQYISEEDLSKDRVILDEQVAWKLYGSVDIEGMEVEINDKKYIISGVIQSESDPFNNIADEDNGRIYMSYNRFSEVTDVGINSYEIIIPEFISGFGYTLVDTGFQHSEKEVINNSKRFGIKNILDLVIKPYTMVMHNKGIAYPYWENAARVVQYWQSLLLFSIIILCFILLVMTIVLIKQQQRYIKQKCKSIIINIMNYSLRLMVQRIGERVKNGRDYFKKLKKNLWQRCTGSK
ncbi:ABC transporter permease [Clostridiisalibacter paucivorans]|uniref:ABC transporter permease n=1 Tax=Clostridiisalibacter paucivorans TaxID=408753 RepID=UPI0024DE32CD|nr:ABC transporter permease [Clostridiisalibacter paucivorans]